MKKVNFVVSMLVMFTILLGVVACAPAAVPTPEPAKPAVAEPVKAVAPASAEITTPDIYKWMDGYTVEMVDTAKYKKAGPYKFGFSNCSTSNAWGVVFTETAKWEAKKHPEIAEFFATDAGDKADKQLSDVEDLIAKGIDVLVIRPCTLDAAVPGIEKAMDMGIPVIVSNRSSKSKKFVSQQATSMIQMGRNQATWLMDQLDAKSGKKLKIVSIEGPAGSGPQIDRFNGAQEIIAKFPNVEIVARKQTNWNRAEAKSAMEDYLQSFPDVNGVLSQAGMISLGAAEALEEAGKKACSIPISGDDYNGWMKWVDQNGCGMITTNPTWTSGASIIAALQVLNGQPVPKLWYMQTVIYDKSTIKDVLVADRSDDWYPSILPADWKISK